MRRLLFPTEALPIRSSLQSTTESAAAIDEDKESVADSLKFPVPSLERLAATRGGHVRICDRRKPAMQPSIPSEKPGGRARARSNPV